MPKVTGKTVVEVCELWGQLANQHRRFGLWQIDAMVADLLNISASTVRNYRLGEGKALVDWVFVSRALRRQERGTSPRHQDIPEEQWQVFSRLLQCGTSPTRAYGAVATLAGEQGLPIASESTFLRHLSPKRRRS